MSTLNIVHIEDNAIDAKIFRERLLETEKPVKLFQFSTLKEGLTYLKQNKADIVFAAV